MLRFCLKSTKCCSNYIFSVQNRNFISRNNFLHVRNDVRIATFDIDYSPRFVASSFASSFHQKSSHFNYPIPLPFIQLNAQARSLSVTPKPSQNSETELRNAARRKNAQILANAKSNAKHSSTLLYLSAVVVAMLGLSYASVPLYRMFCQATGFGGAVKRKETVEEKIVRHDSSEVAVAAKERELVIRFNADVADGMPWKFLPSQREVRVHPGESTLAFYTAQNLSDSAITGVSTYNVSPNKAGQYFNKIQCFCFEEQRLKAKEKIDMPVFFYIDPEFATDPKMRDVKSLTLSYTFFKVNEANQP